MGKKTKVSVIVPVYNSEKYLYRCIESIRKQTLKEIEIIIINDGSKDSSLQILNKYKEKDKRIILINQINKGVSSARNRGLEIAKGEYCLNIDSDDWVEENYCEIMYNKAKKDNLDIVISDFFDDWDNGKIKYNNQLILKNNEIIKKEVYLEKIINGETNVYMWNKLVKREIYNKFKILYPQNIKIGEDFVVLVQLIYFSNKIGKINQAFYHYIKNESSIMRNMDFEKLNNWMEAFKIVENFFEKKEFDKKKLINRKLKNLSILFNINLKKMKKNEEIIDYYITSISNSSINYRNFSLKLRVYFYILKKYKNRKIFFLLNIINRNIIKIKKVIKL